MRGSNSGTYLEIVLNLDPAGAKILGRVVELMDAVQIGVAGQVNRAGWRLRHEVHSLVHVANVGRGVLLLLECIGLHEDVVRVPVLILIRSTC